MRRSGAVRRAGTRGGGSPVAWDPSKLASLVAWWRADTGVTLATGVSDWTTKYPAAAYTASQATGANQPTYNATARNGMPGIVFDSGTKALRGTISAASALATALDGASAYSIAVIWSIAANASSRAVFVASDTTANNRIMVRRDSTTAAHIRQGTGAETHSSTSAYDGYLLYTATYDGSNSRLYLNGALDNGPSAKAQTPANLTQIDIGQTQSGTNQISDGTLFDIIVTSTELSLSEVQQVNTYRTARYGA